MRPPQRLPNEENEAFFSAVIRGLSAEHKELPCKYFYDETGSRLFEMICGLDEYYLTGTEFAIMSRNIAGIAAALGSRCLLIEPGAGSGHKTDLLLAHLQDPAGYIPIDIAREHVANAVTRMTRRFSGLKIAPVYRDFTEDFRLPVVADQDCRRIVYFPGSTIGNFDRSAAKALLRRFSGLCGNSGGVLIGVDLKKDPAVLERAYNDEAGITAAFNLNLLVRINNELGADFRLSRFTHQAFYNPEEGRIEMHLVSLAEQSVMIAGVEINFRLGETIHTENCYKYSLRDFEALAALAGLHVDRVWTDEKRYFSVQYLRSAAA